MVFRIGGHHKGAGCVIYAGIEFAAAARGVGIALSPAHTQLKASHLLRAIYLQISVQET